MKLSLWGIISVLLSIAILPGVFVMPESGARLPSDIPSGYYSQQLEPSNSKEKSEKAVKKSTAPADVTVLKIASRTASSVSILWKRIKGVDGYFLYIYNNEQSIWEKQAKISVNINQYTFTDLNEFTKYGFAVKAYKTINGVDVLSENRAVIKAYTLPEYSPESNSDFRKALVASRNRERLLDESALYGDKKISKQRLKEREITSTVKVMSKFLSLIVTSLIGDPDATLISSEASLPKVTGITAEPSCDRIRLSWEKTVGADGYILYSYSVENKKWERNAVLYSNVSEYTFTCLDENTKYGFAVKAFVAVGKNEIYSKSCDPITVSTTAHSVTGLLVTASDTCAKVTWDANGQIDKYFVFAAAYGKRASRTPVTPIAVTKSNSYIFSGLKPSVEYRFFISGSYGENGYDIASVTQCTIPKAVHLTSAFTDENKVELKWEERKSADDYIIYTRRPGERWKKVGETADTAFLLDNYDCEKYYAAVVSRAVRNEQTLYSEPVKCCILNSENPKKMYVDGDSIAFGKGANGYSFASLYAERHNTVVTNNAFGGATIASGIDGCNPIAQSVMENVDGSFDIIMLDGGLNDYYYSAELGKMTLDSETQFDMNTTCGALEAMLSHIKTVSPDSAVYFISVHKITSVSKPNERGLTYEDYKKAIEEICEKYGVTVIDCYNCGLDPSMTDTRNGILPEGDGVHPTQEGYRKYYLPIIEETIHGKKSCKESACKN